MNPIQENQTRDLISLPKIDVHFHVDGSFNSRRPPIWQVSSIRPGQSQGVFGGNMGWVDFDEIFSPIVKMKTLRFLIEVVTTGDLELLQLNAKTLFHGDRKNLYSLQQAPTQWYRKFDNFIQFIGFSLSDEDIAYTRKTNKIDHPSSLCSMWTLCCAPTEMPKSLLNSFSNCD